MHHPVSRFVRIVPLLALGLALTACDGRGSGNPAAPGTPGASGAAGAGGASSDLRSVSEAEDARRIYYQFVDSKGGVHFVPTLDAVPPEWRGRVGFVEMTTPPPTSPAEAARIREATLKRSASSSGGGTGAASGRSDSDANHSQLILYAADWCGACRAAKSYLDGKGIAYEERNVDEARWLEEMHAKAGPGGIPVFDIHGQILRGFSAQMLDEALGKS